MRSKYLMLLALPLLAACGGGGSPEMTKEVERGAVVFKRVCEACHLVSDRSMVGPGLKGIIGRPIASVEDFDYSDAMLRDKDVSVWTRERIKSYIMGPMQMYPEGRMVMDPLNSEDADAVLAYLAEYP